MLRTSLVALITCLMIKSAKISRQALAWRGGAARAARGRLRYQSGDLSVFNELEPTRLRSEARHFLSLELLS